MGNKNISFFRNSTSLVILLHLHKNRSRVLYASKIAEELSLKENYTMSEVERLLKFGLIEKNNPKEKPINKRIKVLKITSRGDKVIHHTLELKKLLKM